jgi:outer membrane protein OmpA-like peptidoglycan-associated protein
MRSLAYLRTAAALFAALLGLLGAGSASAQVTLDQFRTAETVYDGFAISRPDDRGHLKFGVHLNFDYANDPLVFESTVGNADTETTKIVEHQLVGALALNLGIADRIVLFAGLPVSLWMEGDAVAGGGGADGAGIGDPWVGARLRLLGENDDIFGLGLQAAATLPVAKAADDTQVFRGEDGLSFIPKLLVELRPGPVRLTGNVGVQLRKKLDAGTFGVGNELRWGFGATFDLVKDRLTAHGEIYGATPLGKIVDGVTFGDREGSPLEAIAGLKYYSPKGFVLGLAGGPGLLRGYGSPDFRAIAQIGFAQRKDGKEEAAPVIGDADQDGIRDDQDGCPQEPEDQDSFEDEDGCPDPDNDQDGVLDVSDGAPMDPEDKDGFEDEDGVPDPDNDKDGIVDGSDNCPLEAEDADGYEDEDGCPDPDNDKDGVPDVEDKCPTAPGEASTNPEENGCPKTVRVDESTGQIMILKRVEFATSKDVILKASNPILVEVGATIAANKQIKKVRVEGHTDDRGNAKKNQELSKRRAKSVVTWLIENGIEADRLEAYGCGPNVPIESNKTNDGRQANRRVEFHIVDPAPANGLRSTEGCELVTE